MFSARAKKGRQRAKGRQGKKRRRDFFKTKAGGSPTRGGRSRGVPQKMGKGHGPSEGKRPGGPLGEKKKKKNSANQKRLSTNTEKGGK